MAMWRGIRAIQPGARLGDIGHAIQTYVEEQRFSVVREYCGHGIGRVFHEDPQVLHYGRPGTGVELVPGMTITVEPMVNAGKREVKLLPRRLDRRDEGSLAVRAVGAHGARHADGLRGIDAGAIDASPARWRPCSIR